MGIQKLSTHHILNRQKQWFPWVGLLHSPYSNMESQTQGLGSDLVAAENALIKNKNTHQNSDYSIWILIVFLFSNYIQLIVSFSNSLNTVLSGAN